MPGIVKLLIDYKEKEVGRYSDPQHRKKILYDWTAEYGLNERKHEIRILPNDIPAEETEELR